jgi:hypothetical protein
MRNKHKRYYPPSSGNRTIEYDRGNHRYHRYHRDEYYNEEKDYGPHYFDPQSNSHRIESFDNSRNFSDIYGENPNSWGSREYEGSNKRYPGLGRNNYNNFRKDQHEDSYSDNGRGYYYPEQAENDREREDYFNADRDYRHHGYQSSSNVEGFGLRNGRQGGLDWRDEDEYRHGLAQRRAAYGKYGSR